MINLKKQKIASLTVSEMSQVNGGAEARSDRRNGNCRFSRKHGTTTDPCGDVDGCNHISVSTTLSTVSP